MESSPSTIVTPDRTSRRGSWEDRAGYACQLAQPAPAHLQTDCSVCLQILREPCIVSCCGQKFCRECIELVVDAGKDCPLCNGRGFTFMAEHSLSRTLLDLDVFCSAREEGCTWIGKLRSYEAHLHENYSQEDQLTGCQFVKVMCIHPGCGVVIERRLAAVHQERECQKRPHVCEHCSNYSATYEDVTTNHYSLCGNYPVICPNSCTLSPIRRCMVEHHLKYECSLSVTPCPFHYAGCDVVLPKVDMTEHVKDMSAHFALLASTTHKLVAENTELRRRVDEMAKEAKEREKIAETRTSQLTAVCCSNHHYIQHAEMQAKGYASMPHNDSAICTTALTNTLENEMRSMYFAKLPYNFSMKNFLSYSKGGPVEYSPVYYTHSFGYKFRVKVIRTEYSKLLSLDAFTSIFVEFLVGPYDDQLTWPFQGSITVAIINQLNNSNHFKKKISFPGMSSRVRPERCSPVTVGLRPFIFHKDLRNTRNTRSEQPTQYIVNGTLLFRITAITVNSIQ